MANKDEHWLSNQLKKELKKIPNIFVQQYIATPQTGRGNPDFLIVVNGYPLFVELKHPTDFNSVPRPEQRLVHKKIRKAKGYVLVSRSVDRVLLAIRVIQSWGGITTGMVLEQLVEVFGEDGMREPNEEDY